MITRHRLHGNMYEYQRDARGRFVRAVEILTKTTTLKTAKVDDREGAFPGRLDMALGRTNFLSTRTIGAKRLDIVIKGKNGRDKPHRFHLSKTYSGKGAKKDINLFVISMILAHLKQRKYRTNYNLDDVDWRRTKEPRSKVERRKVLHNVTIVVKVSK